MSVCDSPDLVDVKLKFKTNQQSPIGTCKLKKEKQFKFYFFQDAILKDGKFENWRENYDEEKRNCKIFIMNCPDLFNIKLMLNKEGKHVDDLLFYEESVNAEHGGRRSYLPKKCYDGRLFLINVHPCGNEIAYSYSNSISLRLGSDACGQGTQGGSSGSGQNRRSMQKVGDTTTVSSYHVFFKHRNHWFIPCLLSNGSLIYYITESDDKVVAWVNKFYKYSSSNTRFQVALESPIEYNNILHLSYCRKAKLKKI